MLRPLDRRRFIAISAAAAGCALVPVRAGADPEPVTWRGQALGAEASLTIHHRDRAAAERLVREVVAEVARLEEIFSLYRADSALSELNRLGALAAPPADLVALLAASREAWELSGGAFDPTVQPVWTLLAEHFSRPGAEPAGPSREKLGDALALVGFDKLAFSRDRIAFGRSGMALTLNGIAQGYITDRAVDLLRRGGIEKSLVNMGEIRGLGTRHDGSPWRVGIEGHAADAAVAAMLEIEDEAVSTSSADGFLFDAGGRFSHILDPRSGAAPRLYRAVTVIAPDATSADALSTAFSLMRPDAVERAVAARGGLRVLLFGLDGSERAIG